MSTIAGWLVCIVTECNVPPPGASGSGVLGTLTLVGVQNGVSALNLTATIRQDASG